MTDQTTNTKKPAKLSYLGQGWLVLVLAGGFGGLLAYVESNLKPKIEQNKADFTLTAIPELVPGATKGKPFVRNGLTVFEALDDQDKLLGWVISTAGDGFADRIELLIGLDVPATTVTGIKVLSQKETPGLGAKIEKPDTFSKQFIGKSATSPIGVAKGKPAGNQVQAITGATVSSEAVASIMNKAMAAFRADLPAEARQ
ncbi:MAG: FMN-binding protein [Planctomycetes bacterium]|jgi:electron transport complex protein RnfG|nr:FMN-binding protein [Planctomycetota bacterium]